MKTRCRLNSVLAGCVLASAPFVATAAELFGQAPVNGGMSLAAAYSTASFFGFQNADSYSASSSWTVTGFRWWGTDVSDPSAFVIRLLPDPIGSPDTFTSPAGTVTKSATALADEAGIDIFAYEFNLTSATQWQAGPGYLSIFLDSDIEPWGWLEGSGADNASLFRGVDGAPWDSLPPDLAFAILGDRVTQPLPEPAGPMLVLIGLAAAGLARRVSSMRSNLT